MATLWDVLMDRYGPTAAFFRITSIFLGGEVIKRSARVLKLQLKSICFAAPGEARGNGIPILGRLRCYQPGRRRDESVSFEFRKAES